MVRRQFPPNHGLDLGCEMRTCSIFVHFLGLIVVERKMELERCGEGIVISMKDPFDR